MLEWLSKLIKALAFIHKKIGLSDSEFRDYYEKNHAPLALSLLTFEGYERNYISSELNPLYVSVGSISIFQYQSIDSLKVIEEQMSSDAGDNLRKDELVFMDVAKNYFVLTQSIQLTEQEFQKKIFVEKDVSSCTGRGQVVLLDICLFINVADFWSRAFHCAKCRLNFASFVLDMAKKVRQKSAVAH